MTARDFARRTARDAATWALLQKATDKSADTASRSCLVLAPHPDDESLGCGGVMALKRSVGSDVTVVVATSGGSGQPVELIDPQELAKVRKAEARKACSILGVPDERVHFWGFQTKQLGLNIGEAEERLVELIRTSQPDEIYVTSSLDHNLDHRALNEIAVRALATSGVDADLIEYPIWFWMSVPWFYHIDVPGGRLGRIVMQPPALLWRLRPVSVDISPVLEAKRAAIDAHASQVTGLTDDPGWKNLPEHLVEMSTRPNELFFPVSPGDNRGRALEAPPLQLSTQTR